MGDVIGFFFAGVWVSGDTVLYDGVRSVASRVDVDVAVIHLGGVRFPITGPLRFTMTARDAVELLDLIRPRVAIPIHYEGWAHFREGRDEIEHLQRSWAELLNAKPYPHPLAVWNVYNLEIATKPELSWVGPLETWDTSYLRAIDDSGYIDELYGGSREAASPPVNAVI